MSRKIWAITDLHWEEYLERELRVEKAVVRMSLSSFPEVYIIASRIYYAGEFSMSLRILVLSLFSPSWLSKKDL